MAAWAVSHCSTVSDRSKYVRILSKYAQVDIYGKCGRKTPPEFETVLQENYKFYLGFENSLCTDYMTEKFFHYYSMDLITILRGKTNYTKYLPKGSYINTDDFKTIRDLAIFLKDLASNESRYTEYLKNKDRFQVYERDFMYRNSLCSICEKLNNLDKYRKSYNNVATWLGLCFKAQDLKDYR
jgi:alpha-1,3-fucosyltransferase